jgi:hypothetical protein
MKTSYVRIHQDHPLLKEYRIFDIKGSCSFIKLGLECPVGDDYMKIIKSDPTYKDTDIIADWIFIVIDERKWLVNKIKYGI